MYREHRLQSLNRHYYESDVDNHVSELIENTGGTDQINNPQRTDQWIDAWESFQITGNSRTDWRNPTLVRRLRNNLDSDLTAYNVQRALTHVPPDQQQAVRERTISLAGRFIGQTGARTLVQRYGGERSVKLVPIVAVRLSWTALKSIAAWWRGDITGERCANDIVGSIVAMVGAVSGGSLGAAIGTAIFPVIGTLIGGVIGGVLGELAGEALSDWLRENLFDLPKTAALEKAYGMLGLSRHCSNRDINSAYYRLSLRYHPDKGGSADEFHKLQVAVQLIKQDRGEGL